MCCSQPVHGKTAPEQCCYYVLSAKEKEKVSSSSSPYFSISMPNLVFSGLIRTMFAPYCCTVRTLVGTVRTPHVVLHKGSGIWSKILVCYLLWCTSSAHSVTLHPSPLLVLFQAPSLPRIPVSVPRSLPSTCSGCRGVENRARATAWGGRGKLPRQQSLDLAACVSIPNPTDKSRCTFPCVIARLSEGTGYLRTCFHRGIIYSGWYGTHVSRVKTQ